MRFIRDLNFDTAKLLERIYKESVHSQVRQRAHCILLSYKGVTIPKLIEIFKVTRVTEVLNVKKSLIKIAQNMLNFGRRIKIF
jgi:hypothetical protein